MVHIHLLAIHCMLNEESDRDEVFLKYNKKKVWPKKGKFHKMNSNQRTEIDVKLKHDPSSELEIQLWDWDLLSSNDLIGTFHMHVTEEDYGKFTTSLRVAHSNSTASYLLEWEILEG